MRGCLLFLICLGLLPGTARATVQVDDILIYEGKQILTNSLFPLEKVFPDIKFPQFDEISTGNRKGYVATWATFQNRLYLIGLEGNVPGHDKHLCNEQITPGHRFPLKVTRWSGKIIQEMHSRSYDSETGIWTDVLEITTIKVKSGIVTDTIEEVIRKPIVKSDQ